MASWEYAWLIWDGEHPDDTRSLRFSNPGRRATWVAPNQFEATLQSPGEQGSELVNFQVFPLSADFKVTTSIGFGNTGSVSTHNRQLLYFKRMDAEGEVDTAPDPEDARAKAMREWDAKMADRVRSGRVM